MKKAVLLIAALLVLSTFAFGEVKLGAWGRGLFVPAAGGDDIVTTNSASWGDSPRIGFTVSGTSDNIGFQADILADYNAISPGDQQKIWAKLFNMLTIQIGKVFDDTLRGNATFGAWNWVRYSGMDGEDALFFRTCSQMTNYIPSSTVISLAPMEALYIYAALNDITGTSPADVLLEDAFEKVQVGAGYTIEGIGQIRAQYCGFAEVVPADAYGVINAAFKLTAVENLLVDLGVFYSTDSEISLVLAKIALYGSYKLDALTLHLYGDVTMYDDALDQDMGITVAGGLDYSLEGGIGINADVRWKNETAPGSQIDGIICGMVGVTMGFSNGLVGAGIEITNGGFAGLGITKGAFDDIAWCIPIRIEYWF